MVQNMSLTENQRRFLQEQVSLWAGLPMNAELSARYQSLILGLTEADPATADDRGNQDFQYNPLFWSGQILEPVINQWLVHELAKRNLRPEAPWPGGKKFAVCLTHDVDWVGISLAGEIRHLKTCLPGRSKGQGGLKTFLKSFGATAMTLASQRRSERCGLFEPWLELEKSLGYRSTFFFFPDRAKRYHLMDGVNYRHSETFFYHGTKISVRDFLRELASNGWEVGLHGTFNSFDDADELKRQKEQVEVSLGREIVSIRQHCLHFNISKTPKAQSSAGFKYDSTFGFNRTIGFRNGLALPFHHYDLRQDKPLAILQIPLHIQDGALLRWDNLGLDPITAVRRAKELITKVEETNGLITLLFHPVFENSYYDKWFWAYQELLHFLKTKEAWVTTVREIGDWWRARGKSVKEKDDKTL